MATRTRLAPELRRQQLLAIGAELFAESPYDEVRIEDVADRAGVSRGLMYRYFATKRDLLRAVVVDASEQVLALTAPDDNLPVAERIATALDKYLAHFEANAQAVRAIMTGIASGDAELLRIVREAERRQETRVVEQLVALGLVPSARLQVAVRGWLLMTRALTLDWLDTHEVSRDELRDICVRPLLAIAMDPSS